MNALNQVCVNTDHVSTQKVASFAPAMKDTELMPPNKAVKILMNAANLKRCVMTDVAST